ncbi:MAG: two-component regulator propeller domain-containing protein [Ferruginibacter sp.]
MTYSVTAQNADQIFRHITVRDGLINNRVTTICRDFHGFVWIGTQAGLQRYDGIRFKNYFADIHDTAALQSDWISDVFEDSKGRLWIGNDHGAPYFFSRRTGRFYNYNFHTTPAERINGIWHFAEDKTGNIWIAGHEGYFRLNSKTNHFEKFNALLGINKNIKTAGLAVDSANNLWLSTTDGVMMYSQQEKKLYSREYNPDHNPVFEITGTIQNVLWTKTDLWVSAGYQRMLYRYHFSTKQISSYSFKRPHPIAIMANGWRETVGAVYSLAGNKILVGLPDRGLAMYNQQADSFTVINADNNVSYRYHIGENGSSSACIAQDLDGNILIGNEKGINIFNPDKKIFTTHQLHESDNRFPQSPVSDFLQLQDGTLFMSCYNFNGGIVKMDSSFHFKKQYLLPEKANEFSSVNQVWNLFKDEHDIIWSPNQHKSFLKLDLRTDRVIDREDTVLSGPVNCIQEDSDGAIWMGHWSKGLVRTDASAIQKKFYTGFLYSDAASVKRVHAVLAEKDKVWVGTFNNGLQVFDKKTEKFTTAFIPDEKNSNSISSYCVSDILRYNKDTLVIATEMGINIFDERKGTFKTITAREGLPNNIVVAITKDQKGNIWAACGSGGFCKIDMQHLSITSYDADDGITDNGFTGRFFHMNNGKMLIGVSSGFISFDPASITNSAVPAYVHITGLHVFEKEMMIDTLIMNDEPLRLSYKENNLRIDFASLQFWSPSGIEYFYQLEGADKDWVTADKTNTAVYNQLKYGEYNFKVRCRNRDGIYCKRITELKIIIAAPWWKTWWFIALLIAAVTALIYLFMRFRERHIKVVEAEKLKVQQLNAEQYKSKLELEQIINYFSSSLIDKNTVEDVLWDVAKNLIARLGFIDCMIYLWNDDKTKMVQKAGFGSKDTAEQIRISPFDVLPGQGMVGNVMETKEALLIPDTSIDKRYRPDDQIRLSEITVPVIYNNELIGVIDSEHDKKNFFTQQHLQVLNTIATLVANKIMSLKVERSLQQAQIEMYSMNDQLSKAKLEALRSQMNPHFIFNSLNAIQECILTNKVDAAYEYLSKFSKLQRMVLHNSEKDLIPLGSETEMLELYLSLESLRFSKSFSYTIDTNGLADDEEIMIPSLITQPIAENAIWHGLRNKEGDKTLLISFAEKNGLLYITIDENGIGREKAALIRAKKLGSGQFDSKGTSMLRQRLQVLGQQLKTNISLEIIDKKDEAGNAAGTTVIISFPSDLGPL